MEWEGITIDCRGSSSKASAGLHYLAEAATHWSSLYRPFGPQRWHRGGWIGSVTSWLWSQQVIQHVDPCWGMDCGWFMMSDFGIVFKRFFEKGGWLVWNARQVKVPRELTGILKGPSQSTDFSSDCQIQKVKMTSGMESCYLDGPQPWQATLWGTSNMRLRPSAFWRETWILQLLDSKSKVS